MHRFMPPLPHFDAICCWCFLRLVSSRHHKNYHPICTLPEQCRMATGQASAEEVKERQARAMSDPEIQNILKDPIMQQVLRDFQVCVCLGDPVVQCTAAAGHAAAVLM
jgi:hypothetical protein